MVMRLARPSGVLGSLALGASLAGALLLVVALFRAGSPERGTCLDVLHDATDGAAIAVPLRRDTSPGVDSALTLRTWPDAAWSGAQRPALYVDEAAPRYRVRVNARDLTPHAHLDRDDLRDLGPQLLAVPRDALLSEANLVEWTLPLRAGSGETRLGRVCLGEYDVLHATWRSEWWRRVGTPWACLLLFAVLAAIAAALRRLQPHSPLHAWQVAALVAMTAACAPLATPFMPGGALPWHLAARLAVLVLIALLQRLLCALWRIEPRRGVVPVVLGLLVLAVGGAVGSAVWPWPASAASWRLAFWLCVAAFALTTMVRVVRAAAQAPANERRAVVWGLLFAIGCGLLDVVPRALGAEWRVAPLLPIGLAVMAALLGFLLVRRALDGTRLLHEATRQLDRGLGAMHLPGPEHGVALWNELSGRLAERERRLLLHDIDQGFGRHLDAALEELRQRHPESTLALDLRRALFDLRLMVDAMEESCATLGVALARLRARMESSLAAGGLAAHWRIDELADVQVEDWRRALELLRCVEELLSNALQHSAGRTLAIDATLQGSRLRLCIEDDGRGFDPAGMQSGRGLRNLHARVAASGGTLRFGAGVNGCGARVELVVPRP